MKYPLYECPFCGGKRAMKILYGYPSIEAADLAEEGKLKLGGCCMTDNDPDRYCPDCDKQWMYKKQKKA